MVLCIAHCVRECTKRPVDEQAAPPMTPAELRTRLDECEQDRASVTP